MLMVGLAVQLPESAGLPDVLLDPHRLATSRSCLTPQCDKRKVLGEAVLRHRGKSPAPTGKLLASALPCRLA